ncbi:MAG: hypothetical protein R3F61_08845 [Myxococcota bacterium]
MSLVLVLLACSTPSTPGSAPTPAVPGPAAAPAPPAPPSTDGPIATRSGEAYSDRWLVILSSKKELGHVPEGATKLLSPEPPVAGADLARLSSTEFKALQPCFEIVVAQAFADRKGAVAFSKQLTAAGIDNYPKNAGTWVGTQPRVDAYCRGEREPSVLTCPSEAALAETVDGRHLVRIDVAEVVARPALDQAGKARKVSDTTWIGSIAAETLGGHQVGDAWTASGTSGPTGTCTVKGFVSATRGTPHFGWYDGPMNEPGCGSPIVMAELSCDGLEAAGSDDADGGIVVATRGRLSRPDLDDQLAEEDAEARAAMAVLDDEPAWNRYRQIAHDQAGPDPVTETLLFERYLSGGTPLVAVTATWVTGQGLVECGGEDVNEAVWALVDPAKKATIAGPIPAYGLTRIVPFDLGSDGKWDVWTLDWNGTTRFRRDDGVSQCTNELAYCDCPC